MGRISIVPDLEKKIGQPLKSWLAARIQEGKDPVEIAKLLEIGKSKAYDLISDYGLKDALKSARKQKSSGGEGELRYYFDKYMAEKQTAGLSQKTISKDVTLFGLYIWWLEHFNKPLDLNAIKNPDIVREFFTYLATQTNRFGREHKKPVSEMGRSSYRKQLVAFVHWLQENEVIGQEKRDNPFSKIMKIKLPKKLPEDIPDIVINKVLGSFDDSFIGVRNKTIFSWFLETGQRLGGVAGIKLTHFNWEKGIGTVTEKGMKERTIVLSQQLQEQVKKYMEIRADIARGDCLWVNEKGECMDGPGIYRIFADLDKQFRDDMVKHAPPEQSIHPHAMRHVWAKHLAQAEVPLFSIMVMAGWENLALVQRYAAAYTQETAWKYINTASPLSKME